MRRLPGNRFVLPMYVLSPANKSRPRKRNERSPRRRRDRRLRPGKIRGERLQWVPPKARARRGNRSWITCLDVFEVISFPLGVASFHDHSLPDNAPGISSYYAAEYTTSAYMTLHLPLLFQVLQLCFIVHWLGPICQVFPCTVYIDRYLSIPFSLAIIPYFIPALHLQA